MYAATVLNSMLGRTVDSTLPADMVPIDRICQRWAISVGDGLRRELWEDPKNSRATPLDDDTAIIVDQIILKSPPRTKRFVKIWYKTPRPRGAIAQEFRMDERSVTVCWKLCLSYLEWKFKSSKHKPLLALLENRV